MDGCESSAGGSQGEAQGESHIDSFVIVENVDEGDPDKEHN
jgi:hypothetical protein